MIGAMMMGVSLMGKQSIKFYRLVKGGNAFRNKPIGTYYQGGFEKTMNRREAALILGVR